MTEGPQKIKVKIASKERLDVYLSREINQTRSRLKKMIETGAVRVNDECRNCSYKVQKNDIITVESIPEKDRIRNMFTSDYGLISQQDNYLIINKPAGVVVHPAATHKEGTLLDALQKVYSSPQLVHRLDKETSGVLIVALNENTAFDIREQFRKKEIKKIYLALVEGIIKEDSGEINIPIRRSRRDPTKMSVGWSNARDSLTRFKVKKRYEKCTYVEVYLLTGRTHQIRVHFSYMGYPVLGDKKYGRSVIKAPRHMLHAWQISFSDPSSGKRVYYESELPEDFKGIISSMNLKI
ncbi:RluA family pseudouridine synthase [Elusimicrobiota bacterium]